MRQPVPFGKYLLLERISVGGMAEVFKAKSFGVEGFEKILAIKRILPSMADDADFIQMFIDEAKIAGQLNHANVAQIFELGRVEESHFIAMEFVWGKDLLQIQNRFRRMKKTMPFAMAAHCVARMCEGLDYAHKKKDAAGKSLNIIHRDVSPQNVLVSYDGEVKVIDFGIAKAASRSTKTQAGVLKGKFGYMSPEQVRGLPLDRRSDVFAIATILYELLTAERLFLGESDFATLEKVRNVEVPPPSQVVPGCPPAIERIIMKGLAKELDDRYQWAAEMGADLVAWLNTVEPPFGMKPLAAWMREQFSPELKRESQLLEEQKKITSANFDEARGIGPGSPLRSTVKQGGAAAVSGAPPVPSLGSSPKESTNVLDADDLLSVDDVDVEPAAGGLSNQATQISAELPPEVRAILEAGGGPSGHAPLASESTQILGGPGVAGGPAPSDMPGQSTMILDTSGAGPAPSDMPGQSTMILDGSGLSAAPPPRAAAPQGLPPMEGQSTAIMQAPSYPPPRPVTAAMVRPRNEQTGFDPPTSHVNKPLPFERSRRRSTLGKDIGIGVGVAAFVILSVLGARLFLGKRRAVGTVVITVSPPVEAKVFIDGRERGTVPEHAALTIKDVAAGEHILKVRSDSGFYEQRLSVGSSDVAAVSAVMKGGATATPVGNGRFKLNLKDEGAKLYVDGAQLDEGAWHEAIPLAAGKSHEFRIVKPGFDEEKFAVTLKAGEGRARDVQLVPRRGHLAIKTDPSSAHVFFNDKLKGDTPITFDDLDPDATVKLAIRKTGFPTYHQVISFAEDNHIALDIKLGATAEEAAPAPAPEVDEKTAPAEATKVAPAPVAKATPVTERATPVAERATPVAERATPAAKPARPAEVAKRPGEATKRPGEAAKPAAAPDEDEDELAQVKRPAAKPEEKPAAKPAVAVAEKPAAKPAGSTEPGFLVANTQPWAKLIIDGKDTGKTTPIAPRSKIPLKPGKHVITFVANGKKYPFDIEIESGQDFRLIKQLDAP